MKPITIFKSGRSKAEHLLKLCELLTNTRRRRMRSDWARTFKTAMHWPQAEIIDRVDGNGALLILRGSAGVTARHFEQEYLAELLRASLVSIVSALDRYCHEVIISRVVAQLGKSPSKATRELRQLHLPALVAARAINHARKMHSRPMNLVRQALQEQLHCETYQRPSDIAAAMRIIGVKNLWGGCASKLRCTPDDIKSTLDRIIDRRNKIVHEGDMCRHKRGGKLRYNKITPTQLAKDIVWVSGLVDAIEISLR